MRWLTLSLPVASIAILTLSAPSSALEPNLDDIWANLFEPRCAGCHTEFSGLGFQADSKLNAYNSLVNQAALYCDGETRVIPGNAQDSYLIEKLEGRMDCGSQMPLGDQPLDQETIDVVREWIDTGATFDPPVPVAEKTWSGIKALLR